MLLQKDGDVFYSRSDLRMLIDEHRTQGQRKLLNDYLRDRYQFDQPMMTMTTPSDYIVHAAAAQRDLSASNLAFIIKDCTNNNNNNEHEISMVDRNNFGALPLHLALASASTNDDQENNRVEVLLSSFPEGARRRDAVGRLPLHVALFYGASTGIIRKLARAFPESLTMPFLPHRLELSDYSELFGFPPLHIAMCLEASSEVIYELLLSDPSSLPTFTSMENIKMSGTK